MPNQVQQKLMDQEPWLRELRQLVRGKPCPKCEAVPGQKCIGSRGQNRYRNHRERWQLLPDCPPMLKGPAMRPPDHFDRIDAEETERDDEDGIRCRRCGTTGLYWQKVVTSTGREDKAALFDGTTKRRHACLGPSIVNAVDAFEAVPE